MTSRIWISASLAAALLPAVAGATTVYSDFGPSQGFNGSGFDSVFARQDPFFGSSEQDLAASFQPSGTYTLTNIDLAVSVFDGTNSFTVEVAQNASGAPGTVLEAFTLSGIPSSPTVEDLTSVLHPTLSSGSTYWIAVFPGGPDTNGQWYLNNTSVLTGEDFSQNGGSSWSSVPVASGS